MSFTSCSVRPSAAAIRSGMSYRGPVLDQALAGVEATAGLDPYAIEFREQHQRAVFELLLARTAG